MSCDSIHDLAITSTSSHVALLNNRVPSIDIDQFPNQGDLLRRRANVCFNSAADTSLGGDDVLRYAQLYAEGRSRATRPQLLLV